MKKKGIYVALFFILSFLAYSSELRVFKDKAIYFPDKPKSFIGFNKAEVYCNNLKLSVYSKDTVNGNSTLEKIYKRIKDISFQLVELKIKKKYIDEVVNNLKINDVNQLGSVTKKLSFLSKQQSEIEKKISKLNSEYSFLMNRLKSMAKETKPYFCSLPGKINSFKIQFEGLNFYVKNKLEIFEEKQNCKVSKILVLQNLSGIDIIADKFYVLNFYSDRFFRVFSFYPWTIKKHNTSNVIYKRAATLKTKEMFPDEPEPVLVNVNAIDTRFYELKDVKLPSDGLEKEFIVSEATVPFEKRLVVFPYEDLNVYREYSFSISFEIDRNFWSVLRGKDFYPNVSGAFDFKKGVYKVFAGIDYSIDVERKKILNFKKEKGLFSKKKVKKDGYYIKITNFSAKSKHIWVIDRVPVSSDSKVVVKNIKVEGANYKMEANGKLIFDLKLKPKQKLKISVSFEIEYPEEQSIYY